MNEEQYILFDQYLQNEMSNEDKTSFEKQLSSDPEMASALETYKDLNSHFENKFGNQNELNAFKENLKSISKTSTKTKVIQLRKFYFAIAAVFALLFGLIYFNQKTVPNYQDFNQHEDAYFTERGDIIKSLKLAQEAFNAKNYGKAIPLFELVIKDYPRPEIEYFYGVSLLEDNRIADAETIFNKLKTGTSIYKTKAVWSLALSKLKQKDYKSCKEILLTIPKDYEDYEQVQKLLKTLD